MWAAAALLCVTIVLGYSTLNYQSQAQNLQRQYDELLSDISDLEENLEDLTIKINIKIDYGNETTVWYNGTRVPLNADLLTAIQVIASVEYSSGEYGAFVEKINDVGGDSNMFWVWNFYDEEESGWQFGPVACDAWVLHNGDIVEWVYSKF
jgi:hypothetical protein